ncbi:hypothetical protein NHQ30_004458 [Ciborinia camelliae]|nr:hypothetical protein NHQ30_004458 [Ciborinia camelliae]
MAPFIAEIPTPPIQEKEQDQQPLTSEDLSLPELSTETETSIPTWQSIATQRQQSIRSSIPNEWLLSADLLLSPRPADLVKTCGLLDAREIQIVYSTAVDLVEKLRMRVYTAVEVTRAFCKASAVAHQATNCLAWTMYPRALARAAELDAYMERTGKPIGPLHGLPISVKEHIYLMDTPSTSGFVAWADNFCTSDEQEGVCIQVLRESGAIFHVKTTNPQGLMALETQSNLYGTTTNPLNTALSPGGSSGGESALIAMRGSILGIGTDIGGSIRNPALSCGLYGLKPSIARLPHSGLSGAHDGMESIIGVVGPLATCMDDVELFCKTLLDAEPWRREVGLIPIPWGSRESGGTKNEEGAAEAAPRKLRIGVIYTDGVHDPHPPISRVLHATTQKLQNAGHTCILFPTHLHLPITKTIDALYLLDAGAEYHSIMAQADEPPTALLSWLLDKPTSQTRSIPEQWTLHQQRNKLQNSYAKLMRDLKVDCIMGPPGVSVAAAHGEARYWGYTSVFNLLDLPVVCVPVGAVRDDDGWGVDAKLKERKPSEMEAQWSEARKYKGASVGIQLVGWRLEEEKLLHVARIVGRDLGLC